MERLYIGMAGHVVCLDKKDGKELWRTRLKSSQITNIVLDDNKIYAASGGHLFCLNAQDGKTNWDNSLVGLGYGPCIISPSNQSNSLIAANLQEQKELELRQ